MASTEADFRQDDGTRIGEIGFDLKIVRPSRTYVKKMLESWIIVKKIVTLLSLTLPILIGCSSSPVSPNSFDEADREEIYRSQLEVPGPYPGVVGSSPPKCRSGHRLLRSEDYEGSFSAGYHGPRDESVQFLYHISNYQDPFYCNEISDEEIEEAGRAIPASFPDLCIGIDEPGSPEMAPNLSKRWPLELLHEAISQYSDSVNGPYGEDYVYGLDNEVNTSEYARYNAAEFSIITAILQYCPFDR
ncbi:hypothetical protein [Rhodococcus zopfii]|uniref:hypothetical protein n=1 Tax=Rhodococcus zopfii TaxID=43772 RepID=UPI000ABE09AF|nr:hypothetical protein [Rhodococcus zopfii]